MLSPPIRRIIFSLVVSAVALPPVGAADSCIADWSIAAPIVHAQEADDRRGAVAHRRDRACRASSSRRRCARRTAAFVYRILVRDDARQADRTAPSMRASPSLADNVCRSGSQAHSVSPKVGANAHHKGANQRRIAMPYVDGFRAGGAEEEPRRLQEAGAAGRQDLAGARRAGVQGVRRRRRQGRQADLVSRRP